MNSSVTCARATSVMSRRCLAISESSRSNGPSKFSSVTANSPSGRDPAAVASASDAATAPDSGMAFSGGVAAGDQFASETAVGLGPRVVGGVGGDGLGRDGCVRELHGPGDQRGEDGVPERLADAVQYLARVQGP